MKSSQDVEYRSTMGYKAKSNYKSDYMTSMDENEEDQTRLFADWADDVKVYDADAIAAIRAPCTGDFS